MRSLFCHYDEIKLILHRTKLDVLMLGETFLNYSVSDVVLAIPGYYLYGFDRGAGSGKRSGGGICAYDRDHYNFQYIQD